MRQRQMKSPWVGGLILKFVSTVKPVGAQWFSGRVLDSRPMGQGFDPHRHHCVVGLEEDKFILA